MGLARSWGLGGPEEPCKVGPRQDFGVRMRPAAAAGAQICPCSHLQR